jgi:hypothetical protein
VRDPVGPVVVAHDQTLVVDAEGLGGHRAGDLDGDVPAALVAQEAAPGPLGVDLLDADDLAVVVEVHGQGRGRARTSKVVVRPRRSRR